MLPSASEWRGIREAMATNEDWTSSGAALLFLMLAGRVEELCTLSWAARGWVFEARRMAPPTLASTCLRGLPVEAKMEMDVEATAREAASSAEAAPGRSSELGGGLGAFA